MLFDDAATAQRSDTSAVTAVYAIKVVHYSSSADTTATLLLALFAAHTTLQNWLVVRCSSSRAHGSSAKPCTGKQQFVQLMYLYTDTASAENDAKHTLISHAAAAADGFNRERALAKKHRLTAKHTR
eukprot:14104-Heterococcus_DN1.PRE.2